MRKLKTLLILPIVLLALVLCTVDVAGGDGSPVVTGVNPDSGPQGANPEVVVAGTNLTGTTAVDFGSRAVVNNLAIAGDAAIGSRSVSVTTERETGTLENGFTVAGACPPLDYPTDRWQRVWADWDGNCLGEGPDEINEQFDNDWGCGELAYGRHDWIRLASSRSIYLPYPGCYQFALGSQDGAQLYIDDSLVIDDWGNGHCYREKDVYVELDAGYHSLEIDYFEEMGAARLSFSYSGSSFNRIAWPSIGFPTIQTQTDYAGGTFDITLVGDQALPQDPAEWGVHIKKGNRSISADVWTTTEYYLEYDLDVDDVDRLGDAGQASWYRLGVEIPSAESKPIVDGLYDLEVIAPNGAYYLSWNAVQVLDSFPASPEFYHVTDPHIGFCGYPLEREAFDEIAVFEKEIVEINLIHPDFVIITGDLVDWSCPENWRKAMNLLMLFEVPVFTTVGNHDYYITDWWTFEHLHDVLGRSSQSSLSYYFRNINSFLNYSFDFGPLHVVCLDSGYDVELSLGPLGTGLSNAQMAWLKDDLDGKGSSYIFMHHPVSDSDLCRHCIIRNRDEFIALCNGADPEYPDVDVRAAYSGHTHEDNVYHPAGGDYYVTTRSATMSRPSGFRLVSAASGGDPTETFDPFYEQGFPDTPEPRLSAAGFCSDDGTNCSKNISNNITPSHDFSDMFLTFIMPRGEYEVTSTDDAGNPDAEIVDTIDGIGEYASSTILYVTTDVSGGESEVVSVGPRPPGTQPLYASCGAAPNPTEVGHMAEFTCNAGGGVPDYTYLWTFGDGGTSALQNPTYAYAGAGVYSACVRVTDFVGNIGECCVQMAVDGGVRWDLNGDGCVNALDVVLVGQRWSEAGGPCWIGEDVNCDGLVSVLDIILIGQHFGEGSG